MRAIDFARRISREFGIDLVRYPSVHQPGQRLALLLKHHRIDVVLDVGANTGQYGSRLREFGFDGRIVSFEPMQREYSSLTKRASGDNTWTTQRYALGSNPGTSQINVAANSISSSILPMLATHLEAAPNSAYTSSETIEVKRLDDVLPGLTSSDERTFLKIDTQGFEREVLEGAENSIPNILGLQIEMSMTPLYDGQMLFEAALQRVTKYGMSLRGIEPGFAEDISGRMFQMDGIFFRQE